MVSRSGLTLAVLALLTLATAPAGRCAPEGGEGDPADSAEADVAVPAGPLVHHVRWDDAITPVTRKYLSESIERAELDGANALLIALDTPGGLLDATRDIVSDFYESRVPVIVWVAPSGARAASAGVFLTMAAHVAAMAPGTNIGAASPITMGGAGADSTLSHKMFEDTAAFIRSIAERRGRNVEWAEQAVREAKSITETEAVELDVVDFVARDVDDLLRQSEGRATDTPDGDQVIRVEGARVVFHEMGLRFRLLALLANPNVAYILLMFGIYGIFFELSNPGNIFPGVVGVIFLILAFYSLQTLPLNLAGLALIVVGLVLFILEANIPSYGLLTIGGIASTVLGAVMLFDSPDPALRASLSVIIPLTIVSSLFFAIAVGLAIRTLRSKPTTGREGMIGLRGTAHTALALKGVVEVHGELWNAVAEELVERNEPVVVTGLEGLLLRVRKG